MENEMECPRCHELADDVWLVRRNGKLERMCPGCAATCRRRGDLLEVRG
jgi:hypothetical protein